MTKKKQSTGKKEKSSILKIFLLVVLILLIIGGISAYRIYKQIYLPNVVLKNKQVDYLYIPTGAAFEDVVSVLEKNNLIDDKGSFEWLAEKKNYKNHVLAGRYKIKNKMNNNQLINLLRSGDQEPVQFVFNNIRTKEQLASKIAAQIEADSSSVIDLLNDKDFLSKYGFNSETVIALFIPNTYEMYWNLSAEDFFKKMAKEYKKFWTEERKSKAAEIGLTQTDVSIIASIVQEETIKNDEKPIVAGAYINRLNKNMLLQADPTVRFGIGDFTIKRILNKHLKYDSPYNTYIYKGLPPGPICLPSISSIDAVLNYKKHDYIYFCAKEDFSGYHNFAKTADQHIQNAKRYQRELNRRKIMK